jgi:hypothetical protein
MPKLANIKERFGILSEYIVHPGERTDYLNSIEQTEVITSVLIVPSDNFFARKGTLEFILGEKPYLQAPVSALMASYERFRHGQEWHERILAIEEKLGINHSINKDGEPDGYCCGRCGDVFKEAKAAFTTLAKAIVIPARQIAWFELKNTTDSVQVHVWGLRTRAVC